MKRFLTIVFFIVMSFNLFSKPIKVLIVTGQNNHNWQESSIILNDYLNSSGIFISEIAVSPEQGKDMSVFTPEFSKYDAVVLDYTGDAWPEKTRNAFLEYVKKGGGVVVYHAGNNAFRDWKEFNEIIGLGGWGDRNEADGPYVYWKDGKIVRDYSPGPGGSHGAQHQFKIVKRAEHPIMKDLPSEWTHAQDELYDRLRGPAKNLSVLATAFSDKSTGGTGRDEPILFTVTWGKGRIFQTVIGHVGSEKEHPAIECVDFKTTFLRGVEWAATGKVKQKVPADFPKN